MGLLTSVFRLYASDRWLIVLVVSLVCVASGCGGDQHVEERESAEDAYESGLAAYEAGDWTLAKDKFLKVVNGVVNADVYSDAGVKLAIVHGKLGELDEAIEMIAKLEAGAPNMDEVLAAKAFVLQKKGNTAEAKAAFSQAKKFDPRVKLPQ